MNRLPRRVIVNGIKYKITGKNRYGIEGVDGLCQFQDKEIYIRPDSDRPETLLHEVLHAIFHEYKVKRNDRSWYAEDTVETLTIALMQVMEDNPKLMEFLWKQ